MKGKAIVQDAPLRKTAQVEADGRQLVSSLAAHLDVAYSLEEHSRGGTVSQSTKAVSLMLDKQRDDKDQ